MNSHQTDVMPLTDSKSIYHNSGKVKRDMPTGKDVDELTQQSDRWFVKSINGGGQEHKPVPNN